MNAIKKINTSNGILEDGIMKHSVGFGSLEISNLGIELFGATPFYAPFPLSIFSKNTRGDNVNTEYYLTTRYAKKWNAHIEELDQLNKTDPLMDRAIELAVDGIEILGYGPPKLDQIEDGYEYDYISDPTDDLESFTTASTITSSVFHDDTDIYFKRKIKKTDPLMERAIKLAVDGIEILGYGRPEGYEIKEGYEYDYINEYYENLNVWTTQGSPLPESDRIYLQRPIKTSSCRHLKNYTRTITEYCDPDLSPLTPNQLKNYHRDKWLELVTGSIPKDQHGEKNGTLTSVAKALYGKGGAE